MRYGRLQYFITFLYAQDNKLFSKYDKYTETCFAAFRDEDISVL